jgi:hypothetical protein
MRSSLRRWRLFLFTANAADQDCCARAAYVPQMMTRMCQSQLPVSEIASSKLRFMMLSSGSDVSTASVKGNSSANLAGRQKNAETRLNRGIGERLGAGPEGAASVGFRICRSTAKAVWRDRALDRQV